MSPQHPLAVDAPKQDHLQIFVRTDSANVSTVGGYVILDGPTYTRIGAPRSTGAYDFVVAPPGNPYATHNSIQEAVDAASDGDSILILEGDYSISVAGNAPVDANAAVSWTGKTLQLEGEGWNTRVVNAGGLTRAFGIQSTTSTLTAALGNGSVIRNLRVEGFTQSVRFDAQTFGIRFCSVDLWNVGASSYTAPAVTGSGTSADLTVCEKTYNTALSPTFQVRTYTLQGSTVATETLDANDQYSLTATNVLLTTTFRVASTSGDYIKTVPSATVPQVQVVSHGVGTATPHLSFVSDTDTGFSVTAANTLSLLTGGASRLAVSTTSAVFSLPIQVSSTNSTPAHLIQTGTGNCELRLQRSGGTTSDWLVYLPTGSTNFALNNGSNRLTLSAAGNLTVTGSVTASGTTSAAITPSAERWVLASAFNTFFKFSSANQILANDAGGFATSLAYTGTTGTGNLVFATNPTISGLSLSNPTLTGTVTFSGIGASKWLYTNGSSVLTGFGSPNNNRVLGTGASGEPTNYTYTGTAGSVVMSNSPTIVNPTITGVVTINKSTLSTQGITVATTLNDEVEIILKRTVNTPANWENYIPAGSTDLRWWNGSSDRMVLTNGGDLSISGYLEVGDGSAASPTIRFGGDADTGLYLQNDNQVAMACAGTLVAQAVYDGGDRYFNVYGTGGRVGLVISKAWGTDVDWSMVTLNNSSDTDLFFIPGYQTSVNDTVLKLQANGSVWFPNHNTTTFLANVWMGSNGIILRSTASSRRYKEEIRDLSDEVDTSKVYSLRPVTFRYTREHLPDQNGERYIGLVAEEVAEVFPQMAEYDEDGNVDNVRYAHLAVLLIDEMKKMKREIDALKSRLQAE